MTLTNENEVINEEIIHMKQQFKKNWDSSRNNFKTGKEKQLDYKKPQHDMEEKKKRERREN